MSLDDKILDEVLVIRKKLDNEEIKNDNCEVSTLLKSLGSFEFTKESANVILKKTLIGRKLTELSKDTNLSDENKLLSKRIVAKWKAIMDVKKPSSENNGKNTTNNGNNASSTTQITVVSSNVATTSSEKTNNGTITGTASNGTITGTASNGNSTSNGNSRILNSTLSTVSDNGSQGSSQNLASNLITPGSQNITTPPGNQNILGISGSSLGSSLVQSTTGSSLVQSSSGSSLPSGDKRQVARDKIKVALPLQDEDPQEMHTEYVNSQKEPGAKTLEEVAASIEQSLFDHFGGQTRDYFSQLRSIMSNLKDKKNPDFRRASRQGTIPFNKYPTLSGEDMASNEKNKDREAIRKQAADALESDWDKKKNVIFSSSLTCGKCKESRCTFYQLQTRSSDEPMTTFVTCTVCGNRWKFC